MKNVLSRRWTALLTGAGLICSLAAIGCSEKTEQPDCVPQKPSAPAQAAGVERTAVAKIPVDKEKADWCRACVLGPHGYASCQRVYAAAEGELRDDVRARAKKQACDDAGFKPGECQDKNVIALLCKGDPPPPNATEPGKALQMLFYGKKPGGGQAGPAAQDPKEASPRGPAPQAPDAPSKAAPPPPV